MLLSVHFPFLHEAFIQGLGQDAKGTFLGSGNNRSSKLHHPPPRNPQLQHDVHPNSGYF